MDESSRIASVEEVPEDGSFLFRVADGDGDEREAILVRGDDGVVGWLNQCQHFTHIRLDKGSGVPFRGDELICSNHGAMFDADSGQCTYGPCEGAYLEDVGISAEDGAVYLDDEGFSFVGTGPKETDELDLTSTSNVEF